MRPLPHTIALALALLAGPAFAAAPVKDPTKGPGPETFPSAGKRIRVERFAPAKPGKYPAVVLLHGLDGLQKNGKVYRGAARRLADKGFVVVLVHYFDSTGTRPAELPALLARFKKHLRTPGTPDPKAADLDALFARWSATVRDAVRHARTLPGVDPDRVGLVGVSMGGFLATAGAADPALKVNCVAELFAGLPRARADTLKSMPPTLILHGEEDRTVSVKEAYALRDLLEGRKLTYQIKVYPGMYHGPVDKDDNVLVFAAWDIERRTAAFLTRHLRPAALSAKKR